jgi:hypothetical protein
MGFSHRRFKSVFYYRVCCFVLFFLAAAASFNGFYDKWTLRDTWNGTTEGRTQFEPMLDGTADRPYVYRQLLPQLANWIDARVSEHIKDRLFEKKEILGLSFLERSQASLLNHVLVLQTANSQSPIVQDRKYFLRYAIVYVIAFLFAWIAVYAMFLAGKAVGYPPFASALAAIAMILLMPYFMSVGGYFYDYPELAFFALAVWMATRFDWWWIVPLAVLGTWNKESFLLFIPSLYPILRQRSSQRSALTGTGVLGFCCAIVYFLLRMRYQHNPGGAIEMHIIDQVHYLLNQPTAYSVYLEKTYGLTLMERGFDLLVLLLIVWTAWRGWNLLPRPVRRHAQIAATINIPLYFVLCAPGELRDLSMLYITLLFLLAANVNRWMEDKGLEVFQRSMTLDLEHAGSELPQI